MRRSYPESPPRVEYGLTEKGVALLPIVDEMRRFGHEWLGCGAHPAERPSQIRTRGRQFAHTRRAHRAMCSRLVALVCAALVGAALVPAAALAVRGAQVPPLRRCTASRPTSGTRRTCRPGCRSATRTSAGSAWTATSSSRSRRAGATTGSRSTSSGCRRGRRATSAARSTGSCRWTATRSTTAAGEASGSRGAASPRLGRASATSCGVHSRGPLPDVALARVAASGKRFAR